MATYRYYTADILTGTVLAELPLFGVTMDRKLSAAGNISGSMKLGSGQHNDDDLITGSEPQRSAVYCERDGTLIWGGILWSRSYDSTNKTCALTGQTFESYFDHVAIQNDFIQDGGIDQLEIFRNLINVLQGQAGSNIGLDVSGMSIVSGVPRTILIPGYEYHLANEVVSQLVGVEDGFDYTIDVVPSGTVDQPNKLVRVGYPTISDPDASAAVEYDYPGNITSYTWPETGGGTRFAVLGAGAGSSMFRAESVASDLIAAGFPSWWVVKAFKNLVTDDQVTAKAAAVRDLYKTPTTVPEFTLKPDREPEFEAWSALGSNFNVHIEDARFPNGKDVSSRMTGWSLTPESSNSTEVLKFTIEGTDDA